MESCRLQNDADGRLTKSFIEMYGRIPEYDPRATGYLPSGEPTYLQIVDQTEEELQGDLEDLSE
jgi:hypothetical protein